MGAAPRVLLSVPPNGNRKGETQIRQALDSLCPGPVTVIRAPHDSKAEQLAAWMEQHAPNVVLALSAMPPRALLAAALARNLPVILADADVASWAQHSIWQRLTQRRMLTQLTRVLVPDAASYKAAIQRGADHVAITGALTETRPPLRCSDAELDIQTRAIGGRAIWYAVDLPQAEEAAVLQAHHAALGHSHRALLLIQPADPARAPALAQLFEAEGMHTGMRGETDMPSEDHQVLILDEPGEEGLWYRLAPVTLMGGTLSGDDTAASHPFGPAALGSAILHGPVTRRYAASYQQLERARAACLVPQQSALAESLAATMEPECAAQLAERAWNVSTGGAAVAAQIAQNVAELAQKRI